MAERMLRVKYKPGTSPQTRFLHTANILKELIEDGIRDEYVRRKAIEIVNRTGVQGHDELGEIRAICKWVQRNLNYRKDPIFVEYFHTARRLLKDAESGRSAADCDDMVIVGASLLGAIGYESGAIIVDSNGDGVLNHVMLVTRTFAPTQEFGKKWIPCELILGDSFDLGQSVKVSHVYPLIANPDTTRQPLMKQQLSGVSAAAFGSLGSIVQLHPIYGALSGMRKWIS